jgi:hypothetical protein
VLLALGLSTSPAAADPGAAAYSLAPSDIETAYALPKTGAPHQTIAIVSPYDDPQVQTDLNDYTKRFGIPACTVANKCFRKLNQDGATSPLPQADPSGYFLAESSVGVEVARGLCQSCSILLVEARSVSKFDVSTAVNTAAKQGATVVVTAYEDASDPDDETFFRSDYGHPGTAVVAASGDGGYREGVVFFPASMPNVIAVGGTHLDLTASGKYKDEIAWQGTTSGCSPFDHAPEWQKPFAASVGCGSMRAIADLAAVADPGMLVHIQDAGPPCGRSWCEAAGTSVAAPIIGGVIGLAGSLGSAEAKTIYAHAHDEPGVLRDITTGSNGVCNHRPTCQARRGYDAPTGLGTPYGLAAFLASGGALDSHRPLVTPAPANRPLAARSDWSVHVSVRNQNPFAVHGSMTIWAGRRALASIHLAIPPLATATPSLAIANRYRSRLASLGTTQVRVVIIISGPAGHSVTVSKQLPFHAA